MHGALLKLCKSSVRKLSRAYTTTRTQPRVYNHRVYNHRVYITTTALWISPLTGYSVPVAIVLGLFPNIRLILTASAILHVFTASIGGRRRSRHDSGLHSCLYSLCSLRNGLYSLCSSLYSLCSNLYSLCSNLYSLYSNLYSLRSLRSSLYSLCSNLYSLCSSLRNSLRVTAPVVTSYANRPNLISLKLAKSAV